MAEVAIAIAIGGRVTHTDRLTILLTDAGPGATSDDQFHEDLTEHASGTTLASDHLTQILQMLIQVRILSRHIPSVPKPLTVCTPGSSDLG